MMYRVLAALVAIGVLGCGDDGGAGTDGGTLVNGCPTHPDRLANPGDPIDGDTYVTFAQPFFAAYCTRCHASTLSGDDRNGAPAGYDWDVEATVRLHQSEMRNAIGVANLMPPTTPRPTCAERERLVRWIDADNP